MEMTPANLRQKFGHIYKEAARKLAMVRSPGRVNLIGEHTDYNEGFVFPAAVDRATFVAAQRRGDNEVNVYSANFEEKVTFDIRAMKFDKDHGWANYPKAVLHTFMNRGWKLEGMNIFIESDVPLGGGMSSSAALECAVARACIALFPYQMDRLSMVKLCQRAENQFVGVACGIMDQFASAFGRKGSAIFLDCRTLVFEHVPLNLEQHALLIVNSGVKRKLASAEYNKRREQCGQAVKEIKAKHPKINALRDVEPPLLGEILPLLSEVLRKRTEHVVRECQRTREAGNVLKKNDLASFGRLMNESHDSLKNLYEVSCPELDGIVDTLRPVDGVLGARMMGGGFGGCVIALLRREAVEAAKRNLQRGYQRRFGVNPESYEVRTADGTAEISPS